MSDSLRPQESQHARPPCPWPTPRVHPNSCASSRWCHSTISSSVVPFSSCPQSLPASGSFPMSELFSWGGQSIKSFSLNISPSNEHPGLVSFRKLTWPYVKQIANGNLLYFSGNSNGAGLCINLDGWDREGDGKEFQKGGDICIPMADLCWGLTENSKIL